MKVIKRFNIFVHRGCNLNCYFCPERKKYVKIENNQMENILELLEILYNEGIYIENLKFFGGEPLLNFDFIVSFIEQFYSRFGGDQIDRFINKIRITTNGWLLNDDMIDFFNKNSIRVNVSLNGTKNIYEKDRGLKISDGVWDKFILNIKKIQNLFINFNISPLVVKTGLVDNFVYIYEISSNINLLPVYFVNRSKEELKQYLNGLNQLLLFLKGKKVYLENYENFSFIPLHNIGINIDVDGKIYFSSYIVELDKKEKNNLLLKDYKDILNGKKIKKFVTLLENLQKFKYPKQFFKINSYLDQGLNLFLFKLKGQI